MSANSFRVSCDSPASLTLISTLPVVLGRVGENWTGLMAHADAALTPSASLAPVESVPQHSGPSIGGLGAESPLDQSGQMTDEEFLLYTLIWH